MTWCPARDPLIGGLFLGRRETSWDRTGPEEVTEATGERSGATLEAQLRHSLAVLPRPLGFLGLHVSTGKAKRFDLIGDLRFQDS